MVEIVQDHRPAEEVVWDFYGTPLKGMRRIQLWRLCDIHKIPYPQGCSKENILKLLEHREIQGTDVLKPPAGMTEETFWKLINGPKKEYHELGGQIEENQTNVDLLKDALEGKSYFEMEEPVVTPGEPEAGFAQDFVPDEPEVSDYATWVQSLSWAELKTEAKGRGINTHKMTRNAIVEALIGHAS